MGGDKIKSQGTQPPPRDRGHPLPRRTTPEKSITLRHHRLARDASIRVSPDASAGPVLGHLARRNSSGDSHDTAQSDPKTWFKQSNENPTATFDTNSMDVDPPFFQKETDSSNEDLRALDVPIKVPSYPYGQGARQVPFLRPVETQSSSADDFRSVIDDLTIENKRLKEELKRLKRFGSEVLSGDKLFEIKVHGLPQRKKRELEVTLRNFAASLEGSTEASSRRKNSSRHAKLVHSSTESTSKHASSSSSHSRPVDSAYASMSVGPGSAAPNSTSLSLGRPSAMSRAKSSEQKVQNYLQDIPEGLYPRPVVVTDKERKKLIVKRLEHLFTGKINGRNKHHNQSMPDLNSLHNPRQTEPAAMAPPQAAEPAREARIQSQDASRRKPRSRDDVSMTHSNGDRAELGGHGNSSRSGSGRGSGPAKIVSPSNAPPPEQRPTRPRDLDPDRVQIPSENMDYIRHLGLEAPELRAGSKATYQDVSPDADGWVYLNLLGNLAQLHMINVTSDFIRAAVSEKSTKFQLSSDGRKVRWRGGTEGTKFSSDSSGDNSQKSPSTDDTDGSNESGPRKKQKTQLVSAASGKNRSGTGPHGTRSLDSFHYKPLFIRQSSSFETSLDDTGSSHGQVDESNHAVSRWDYSGTGSSPHKKRPRDDGAIIYYSGAPFCTDLSRDPGDVSPTTHMTSTGKRMASNEESLGRPGFERTTSGSSLPFRPLHDGPSSLSRVRGGSDQGIPPDLVADEDSASDDDIDFPWCDSAQKLHINPLEPRLEPCGIGGVMPEDHFAVVVTTRRPILSAKTRLMQNRNQRRKERLDEMADIIAQRFAILRASSPMSSDTKARPSGSAVEIEYLSGKVRRLKPVALPPPTAFFPLCSTDSGSDDGSDMSGSESDDMGLKSTEPLVSERVNPPSINTYPDGEDLSSNDEEDEVDLENDGYDASGGSDTDVKGTRQSRAEKIINHSVRRRGAVIHPDSSAATAGGAESVDKSISDS